MKAFEKLARRRFNEGVLAEESVTFVIERLSDNDWEKCRAFQGKSKPQTFLYSLGSNLIEEFARKRFGRPRPPTWLKAQGELWVRMWKFLCLERQPIESVMERLSNGGQRERPFLEDVARTIKARMPNCGLTAMDQQTVEDITAVSDARTVTEDDAGFSAPFRDERAAATEIALMLRSVLQEDVAEEDFSETARLEADAQADAVSSALGGLRQQLSLTAEEKILLRMVFVDGFSKSNAARAIGLADHQGGRIVNAALARINAAIETTGVSIDDLAESV